MLSSHRNVAKYQMAKKKRVHFPHFSPAIYSLSLHLKPVHRTPLFRDKTVRCREQNRTEPKQQQQQQKHTKTSLKIKLLTAT